MTLRTHARSPRSSRQPRAAPDRSHARSERRLDDLHDGLDRRPGKDRLGRAAGLDPDLVVPLRDQDVKPPEVDFLHLGRVRSRTVCPSSESTVLTRTRWPHLRSTFFNVSSALPAAATENSPALSSTAALTVWARPGIPTPSVNSARGSRRNRPDLYTPFSALGFHSVPCHPSLQLSVLDLGLSSADLAAERKTGGRSSVRHVAYIN